MAKTLIALIAALCLAFPVAAAQSKTGSKKPARPAWAEITPAQQQILAPLAGEWDKLDTTRRKKWIAIAKNYPKMTPKQQQRLQTRMKEWAALTPEQRRVAREKYKSVKKLPPEKRKAVKLKWQQYQKSLATQDETLGRDLAAPEPAAGTLSAETPPASTN
jgi:hypothetical protein